MRDCKCGHGWADHWLHNKGDAANCDVYPACTCTQYRPAPEPRKSWQERYCERYTAKLQRLSDAYTSGIYCFPTVAEWEVANRETVGVSFEPFEPSHQSFNNALERDDDTTEAYPI